MRFPRIVVFCLLFRSAWVSPRLYAANYRYANFDVQLILTIANAVNARGDIVGRFDDAGGATHGFCCATTCTPPLTFQCHTHLVRAINAHGDVWAAWKPLRYDRIPSA